MCVCVLLKLSSELTALKVTWCSSDLFPFSTISADKREHCGPPESPSSLFLLDFDVFVKLHFLQSSLVQTIKQYFHVSSDLCVCVWDHFISCPDQLYNFAEVGNTNSLLLYWNRCVRNLNFIKCFFGFPSLTPGFVQSLGNVKCSSVGLILQKCWIFIIIWSTQSLV